LANYFERSLLVFRFACYTQSDFLKLPEDGAQDVGECSRKYFGTRSHQVECYFSKSVVALLEPNISNSLDTIIIIRTQHFGDILQLEFVDSYVNLTLKMVFAYKFLLTRLPTLKRIIVINDDTVVNGTALRSPHRKFQILYCELFGNEPCRIFCPLQLLKCPSCFLSASFVPRSLAEKRVS
uniref:Hexosyltransferase n=1 Tax=Parascaris equorum TaxID=6256 RepID=A0A914R729_PAREQ